ncbi:MAG: TonB family protein [Acidobacteriota bacterium]
MSASYTSFGNYLLLKERSRDGLGTLWRAGEMEKGGFRRIVWLRRFDQPNLNRSALSAESALVGQIAQSFRATNVARNATSGVEGGVPFLAWDYVPSQPLDQLLTRVKQEQFPVAIDNALLITEKLAAALAAALALEARGEPLIHGFLVPQLVLVGNDGEAIVGGFGLDRGLLANLDRAAVQQLAAPYLAPEVLASGTASRRSDVYSLGAILFELLSGSPLPADPAARVAALQAPELSHEEGPIPQDVLAILRKSLAAKPDDRYPSATEFKRELEKLLYGGAYSPTTFNLALFMDRLYRHEIEEEDRELQREKGMDVTPYYQAPRPPGSAAPTPVEPPPAPSPNRTGLFLGIGAAAVLLGVVGYLLLSRQTGKPAFDETAQRALVQQMVQEELAKKEADLRAQLDQEKAKTAEMQRQLEEQQKAAASGKRATSADEQAKLEQKRRDLEAQLAEQKRKEEEIAKIQRQKAEAAAAAPATVATTVPPRLAAVAPTAAPTVQAAQVAAVPTTSAESVTAAATVEPTAVAPTTQVVAPTAPGPGATVHEGDLVDLAQVDTPPEPLTQPKVVLPRTALMSRVPVTGNVILKALVNQNGGVDDVGVLRGFSPPKPGVDEACVDAVKKNHYKPAMKDGKRVKTWITVSIQIRILAAS